MPDTDTICGYGLADVRRTLRDAIDRRDHRSARRWTAELVATPAAVGSLWASYWMAWAVAQGATASPTIPILLRQSWTTITDAAAGHLHEGEGWPAFRNDPAVRLLSAEMTTRLLMQTRQTPVVWPSKEIVLYDISLMRDSPVPPEADSGAVMRVWDRDMDSMELRLMAGRFLSALANADLRTALSAVAWTLMPTSQQSLLQPLRVAERGPPGMPPKVRGSPLWFWLDVGKSYLASRQGLHRGWMTMHNAVAEAFRLHYKRWTAADRMRVLLAWVLQIRASRETYPNSLWTADALQLTMPDVDLPYKEIATELADPQRVVVQQEKPAQQEKPMTPAKKEAETKKERASQLETRMAEADAAILRAMGLSEDDL